MEKIMVVVFDDEDKAYKGIRALRNLDADGSIAIHAGALVRKDEQGTTVVPNAELEEFPVGALAGTLLGGAIGLLAGPAGVVAGASAAAATAGASAVAGAGFGGIAGLAGDMAMATVDDDLVYEVSRQLKPGKSAVVLDLSEDWVTPVDSELQPFSKTIFRRPKIDVEDELIARRAEADQKEMEALDQEMAKAHEERKAKVHARMEELRNRNRRQFERLKQRQERIRQENATKVKALQEKISTANDQARGRIQAQIENLRRQDQQDWERIDRSIAKLQDADRRFSERIDSATARGLRKAAEHFEPKKTA